MNLPFTDSSSSDVAAWGAGEDAQQNADQDHRQIEKKKRPIYIYAKVTKVIEQNPAVETDVRTRLLLLRYVIDVGDEEPKEVR